MSALIAGKYNDSQRIVDHNVNQLGNGRVTKIGEGNADPVPPSLCPITIRVQV